MIYDPQNPKVAMDEHGHIFVAKQTGRDKKGNPIVQWMPTVEIDFTGEFRRPEW